MCQDKIYKRDISGPSSIQERNVFSLSDYRTQPSLLETTPISIKVCNRRLAVLFIPLLFTTQPQLSKYQYFLRYINNKAYG